MSLQYDYRWALNNYALAKYKGDSIEERYWKDRIDELILINRQLERDKKLNTILNDEY